MRLCIQSDVRPYVEFGTPRRAELPLIETSTDKKTVKRKYSRFYSRTPLRLLLRGMSEGWSKSSAGFKFDHTALWWYILFTRLYLGLNCMDCLQHLQREVMHVLYVDGFDRYTTCSRTAKPRSRSHAINSRYYETDPRELLPVWQWDGFDRRTTCSRAANKT